MTKLAMFAAATLLAAAPMTAPAAPGDEAEAEAGYLGVRMQRIEGGLAEALDLAPDTGVLLSQVEEGSPAAKAGLANGDIITKFGDASVGTPSDLRDAVRGAKAGDAVKVTYLRDGKSRTAEVALTAAPARPGRGPMMRERIGAADDDSRDRPRRDRVRDHLRDIREMRLGRERGWLGVSTQPLSGELGEYFGAKDGGALVAEVVDDSPAEKLGLKPGDVIVKVDEESIEDPADLRRAVGAHDEPAQVEVTWVRDRKTRSGKVDLEMREGLAWFGGEGRDMPGFDLQWTPEDRDDMRRRVNAFRMQADEGAQHAIDELREQVKKLQEKVEKLESK